MRLEIEELADGVERQAWIKEKRICELGCGRRWRVYPCRHIDAGEDPVVCTVLEDVSYWHRGRGEAVYEECLHFSLDEVGDYRNQEDCLHL